MGCGALVVCYQEMAQAIEIYPDKAPQAGRTPSDLAPLGHLPRFAEKAFAHSSPNPLNSETA